MTDPQDSQPPRHPLDDLIEATFPRSGASFFRPGMEKRVSPAPGLVAGKVVGDFRLISMIGQGGMGQVWEAEQVSLGNRCVAVKFVNPERVTEKQLAYFEREARAGGRLSHPGLVTIFGHGVSDGIAWIAMELVPGTWTLRDYLEELSREGAVPEGYDHQVAVFVRDVALAIEAAHQGGVIHRDLKPQNILIAPDNHPKVTDFGLARIVEETALSVTGEKAGTYFYMSPEQVAAKHEGVDHRTDIFSLGVLMYEMLALVRPFQGDTSRQVEHQITTKEPPDPRTIRSRIPVELVVIAGKALEKERGRRYQTMAELAEDLRRFLENEPILARPPTRFERMVKACKRHPTRTFVGGVAAGAFLVISGLGAWLAHSNAALAAKSVEATNMAVSEKQRAEEVLRLSLALEYEDLQIEADTLWPPHPEQVEGLEDWLRRAEKLIELRPELASTMDELENSTAHVAADEDQVRGTRWWRSQLRKLIGGIDQLKNEGSGLASRDGVSAKHGWSVPRRLEFARGLAQALEPNGEHTQRWRAALGEIAVVYPGLELGIQVGLVPIGADPDSGLWEFWHVASGEEPRRDSEGRLLIEESSGIVLVLLPAGEFRMGTSEDAMDPSYHRSVQDVEKPLHLVTLSAFFLSKFEVTQAQWLRFTGHNPSLNSPELSTHVQSLLHPVDNVSWDNCQRFFTRSGLSLATEAQWEYGCRAGSDTPWPFPHEDFVEFANIRDLDYLAVKTDKTECMNWSDGYPLHSPVGSFLPNEFGLHDMIGNLWEWCYDGFDESYYGNSPVDGPWLEPIDGRNRIERGGGYFSPDYITRSAFRDDLPPSYADEGMGARPARAVDPD